MPRKPAEARNHVVATSAPDDSVTGKALIDTGSLGGDFLSGDMIRRLQGEKFIYRTSTAIVVCSGLDNACYPTTEMIDVGVEFSTDEKIKKIIYLKCRIFHLSKIDLIIGRPSIKKYGFSRINSSHFGTNISDKPASEQKPIPSVNPLKRKINNRPSWVTASTVTPVDRLSTVDTQSTPISTDNTNPTQGCITTSRTRETPMCACHHYSENMHWAGEDTSEEVHRCPLSPAERLEPRIPERVAEISDGITPRGLPAVNTQELVIATLTERSDTYSRKTLAPDEIEDEIVDTFAPFLPDPTPAEEKPYFLDSMTIEGDEELKLAIRALCVEFAHIFSDTLGDLPADIPPFKIEVKRSQWETYKNSGPVRPQTAKKEAEIAKHIQTMLRSGVIEPSQAHYWNHPVIVTKSDGTYRFCIDFRILNACSQPGTFPLLVIAAILLRIGEHKPDTFGVMDLTSGYHQAPLHPDSRALTAFICFAGVYQFTRVPFGPTRAPSYFQEMMTAVVLGGLVYFICEMYLDDCIVFGRGNVEFVSRLRQVFQRFSDRRIFLKAKKAPSYPTPHRWRRNPTSLIR